MTQLLEQDYELVPVDKLACHPANPRQGDVDAITDSMTENGFYGAVVAQRSTGHVLVGNHRLLAARQQGLAELPVTWVDVDDDRARRILLVDNRSNDRAGYDTEALIRVLNELAGSDLGLVGTGYSDDDLASLLAQADTEPAVALSDPDAIPEAPPEPVTRVGDLWLLGPHKVACANATDTDAWSALLGHEQIDAVWTDPPYGVEYVGKTSDALTISNDGRDPSSVEALLRDAFGAVLAVCAPGAAWYVAAPAGPATLSFATVLTELRLWRQTLVWAKDALVMGHSDYHYRHEVVYFGYGPKRAGRRGRGGAGWYGPNNADTLLEVPRPKASREHPTMKPVELITRCLGNSTVLGQLVADPFAGSGSTVIAGHSMQRSVRATEIDPRYVDVACRRYQEHTGTLPVLEATGETHDFTDHKKGGD